MHRRRAISAAAVTGSVVLLGTVVAFAVTNSSASAPAAAGLAPEPLAMDSVSASASAVADPSTGAATAAKSPAPTASQLAAAVSGLTAADAGHVSVAVEDLGTGAAASYNVGDDYVTASIVKLDILCTMLYQDEQSGTSPSTSELSLITSMIENSDNDAAQHLFEDEGGAEAITAANRVFGLSDTVIEKGMVDEAGYSWGDTTTTVLDQLQLLRQVFTSDSVLTADDRSYIRGLMGHVESDQRWGVSAAADDPSSSASDYLLKNGWLPRRTTELWEINSIGEVSHGGQQYLVAVLSSDNKTMDSGIDVVQQVAKAAVDL